jgi:regulator of nucleoside diphosphate kinase
MEKRTIFITEFDLIRLEGLLEESSDINTRDHKYLNELQNALADCSVIAPEKVPKNVITMNSEFSVEDPDTGEETKYTLVFPEDADISKNKISILAPIGMAVLGYRVGDMIEWNVPTGIKRRKVKQIHYQPEAAGDYHL